MVTTPSKSQVCKDQMVCKDQLTVRKVFVGVLIWAAIVANIVIVTGTHQRDVRSNYDSE